MGLELDRVDATGGYCSNLVCTFHRSLRPKSCCPHCMLPGRAYPARSLPLVGTARVGDIYVHAPLGIHCCVALFRVS